MNPKKFYLLIGTAIVALIAAYWINSSNKPQSDVSAQDKTLLPQLHDHVNDVNAITLTGAGDKVLVTLKRGANDWVVANKSDYPANLAKIRELLIKLDQATILERKTSDPKLYAKLGVDDVKNADAKGVRVELTGLPKPLEFIIGNYNGGGGGGTFVRMVGDKQSWLASGTLTVAKKASQWEDLSLVDIPSSRFRSIELTDAHGKTLKVYKDAEGDANFKVADVPKGREISSEYAPNELASVLASLNAEDANPAKSMPAPDETIKAQYDAFDGLVINAVGWEKDGKDYAQFSAKLDNKVAADHIDAEQAKAKAAYQADVAAADKKVAEEKSTTGKQAKSNASAASEVTQAKPLAVSDPSKDRQQKLDALNKEIATLNKKFNGWTFTLPTYKYTNMSRTMDDMLKPLPSKKSKHHAHKTKKARK